MSIVLKDFKDKIRATYWFVPTTMTLIAAVAAAMLIYLDQAISSDWLTNQWYIFQPETVTEARGILGTIASTALSVVGVVFSITLVPLSIASTQYGSIILRGFLRDRATQLVLGIYSATTFYCLFVLMGLRSTFNQNALRLPVTFAVYLLLGSLLMLVYFFHHVADSLQASTVIEQVNKELQSVIKQASTSTVKFDQKKGEVEQIRRRLMRDGVSISSTREGYVRAIDYNRLMRLAVELNLVFYPKRSPGDFVGLGDELLLVWPVQDTDLVASKVNHSYLLGNNRTLFQDPEYGIELIVTIAVRALSSAINDSSTPILCLNRLGSALGLLAEHEDPPSVYVDSRGELRIIINQVTFSRLVGTAFNRIREYGRSNAEILMKMLETIETVNPHCKSEIQRNTLSHQAGLIERDSRFALPSTYDRRRVSDLYDHVIKVIRQA